MSRLLSFKLSTEKAFPYCPLQGFDCPIQELDSPYLWGLKIEAGRAPLEFLYSQTKLPSFIPGPILGLPKEFPLDTNQYQADLKVTGFSLESQAFPNKENLFLRGYDCTVQLNGVNIPSASLQIKSEGDLPVKVILEFYPSSLDIDLKGILAIKPHPSEIQPHTSPSALFLGLRVPTYLYGYSG